MTAQLHTTAEVATALGTSSRTVRRVAAEHGIGVMLGRSYLFTRADIAALRKLVKPGPGNPSFVPGNRRGQPPK